MLAVEDEEEGGEGVGAGEAQRWICDGAGGGSISQCDWVAGGDSMSAEGAVRDASGRKGNSLPGRLGALPVFDSERVRAPTSLRLGLAARI